MKADYIIRVGEPLSLSLLVLEGDVSNVLSVSAKLKPAAANGQVPATTVASIADFVVTSATAPAVGWNLVITDTTTLKPGFYITNARLSLTSGGPLKTDHIIIEVKDSVT